MICEDKNQKSITFKKSSKALSERGLAYLTENIMSDHIPYGFNIRLACELQFNLSKPAEPKLQFTVQIQYTGSFHGECLDFAVGEGGEVFLFSGKPLHIDNDETHVGKYNAISNTFIRGNDLLV